MYNKTLIFIFPQKLIDMKNIRILGIAAVILTFASLLLSCSQEKKSSIKGNNLAKVANASATFDYGPWIEALNDGLTPADSLPFRRRSGGRYRPSMPQWVQYDWVQPISTKEIAVYLWNYYDELPIPTAYRVQYWDGKEFVDVKNATGLGLVNNQYNITTFDEVKTNKLRLEVDSASLFTANILEWIVAQAPNSPNHPPIVSAGADRNVMLNGKTYLDGKTKSVTGVDKVKWTKSSGPGDVTFEDAKSIKTSAVFSKSGDYELELTVDEDGIKSSSKIKVTVNEPLTIKRLDVTYTKKYKINSPLWNEKAKSIIVNWIPHCIDQINRTDLTRGEGGIDNFIEAAKAIRGEPHGKHKGYVFSNAWVHQTVESMCIALMVDPQGDKDVISAQKKMKLTLEDWIPKILAAQEPDGYLQTAFTLRDASKWKERWSPENRGTHEGYVAGYFIESAINHYTLTEGKDKRLYDAAKKLADCWVANIGPGKKEWFDGHQEMEQALVRFGRFVNDMEGNGRGDSYIHLAKFLLDNRKGGSEYDQSHVPVQQQYEAVGHSVRAAYNYSGMADVAAETNDVDYQSAVMSLWDNLVNKKYYVTGGIGSGETSEGFGDNYSLRNNAYCESCASVGMIFFQYKMNLAYHDAKYADLYEETMYNALLGSLDIEGNNFFYTNPLNSNRDRDSWHGCPCCVGNIPRTLLMIPTWTYVKDNNGIYVNLFIGSTINIEKIAGTDVQMVQETNYPWKGNVSITVNPKEAKEFTVYVRVPNRTTSVLYRSTPEISGVESFLLNGKTIIPKIENGYAIFNRTWNAGDKIELELPMKIQMITADDRIEADKGKVAFRYGPLIYTAEQADHQDVNKAIGSEPFTLEWRKDLLKGVMTIKGKWADGSPLLAIPYYARHNRDSDPISESNDRRDRQDINNSNVWLNKK